MPTMYDRFKDDPDPVVAALAKAHIVAMENGEREVAERAATEIKRLTDKGYEMYRALREAVSAIDRARYYSGSELSSVRLSPTSSSRLGGHADEFLANLASRLTQAAVEYADAQGWSK